MTVRSGWLLPTGQTREDTRLSPLGAMAPETAMTTRDGVIAGGTALNATGIGAMQIQIAVGRAVVQGTDTQGAYPVTVTAPETLTVADGNAQNPRIDAVVLRVYDELYDNTGQTLARIELVQGAPNATPTPPTLPPAALRLWEVTVPAGVSAGTGGITWSNALADRRRYTAGYGGIIPRGWGLSFTGAYPGQYRDNGGGLDRWDGAAWQTLDPVIGWTAPVLAAGYTNNGNSQGNIRYRRITLGGVPFLQLRGGVSWATSGTPPNSSNLLGVVLPANCRPVALTSVPIAAGGVDIKLDAQPSGQLRLVASTGLTTWAALSGVQYPLDA
ncbi:hypothetical protein [Streptomyces xanthochromogenes]|uniref:Uncharacterized protein n=1 Tax=Streptomyces xanthochromogenes TaxID=67384 RepID=A0ABQ2ZYX3_9ACTN|nr:hypothetical protein [Streptomyces xanthochromogenes]GGY27899.1 hypothetical protein GCM10010326_21830 [Streptomyces xanthochromogenes]